MRAAVSLAHLGALVACTTLAWAPHARAEVIRVGDDGVQAAIDRSRVGDVVEVPPGVYHEHVRVEHRITLRGTGGVLDGSGEGTVLTVAAAGTIIEGLRIRNSGNDLGAPDVCLYVEPTADDAIVRRNELTDCSFGIWTHETRRTRVEHNRVEGRPHLRPSDRGNGIHLFDGSELRVTHNTVVGARDGIYVSATDDSLIAYNRTNDQRYGIHYMFSQRNTLRGNHSSHNTAGIALMQSRELIVEDNVAEGNERFGILFRDAQECSITGNVLRGNGQGMFFFSSTENLIANNRLVHNDIGAKIWAGSVRNDVHDNAFIGNRQQVFYVSAEDLVWGDAGRGNLWSDYVGWDQDGDGVGDIPYRLDSFTAVLIHRYPAASLLLRSPTLELLGRLERQMPIFSVPSIVDRSPLMRTDS